jgi:carboxylesterase type B
MALMMSPKCNGLFQRALSMSGSQNISMSLATAETQNQPIVDDAGCADDTSASTLSCLRSLSVSTLVGLIPNSWNEPGVFGMVKGTDGMQWVGLVIVDGIIIPYSYVESYIKGTIQDVPFFVGNMGQEADQDPDKFVHNYTSSEWLAFLNNTYEAFDDEFGVEYGTTGRNVYDLYLNESTENPQKAFDAIVADYGLGCAAVSIMKTVLAPNNRDNPYRSHVYVFANSWNLSKAFLDTDDPSPDYKVHYAYHTLDLYLVTENWYNVGDGKYTPTESDLAGSHLLQSYWYQFMKYGNPTQHLDTHNNYVRWLPINETSLWPQDYMIFAIDKQGSSNVINYRKAICDFNEEIGVSSGRYWWAN